MNVISKIVLPRKNPAQVIIQSGSKELVRSQTFHNVPKCSQELHSAAIVTRVLSSRAQTIREISP